MAFAFVLFGLIMVVTAAKGTHVALGNQLVKDFTGPGNFIYWFIAILVVYAVSRIPQFEKVGKPFLVLVIVSMILRNQGFFQKFMEAIQQGPIASPREQVASGSTNPDTATAPNSGNPDLANVAKITGDVAKVAAVVLI